MISLRKAFSGCLCLVSFFFCASATATPIWSIDEVSYRTVVFTTGSGDNPIATKTFLNDMATPRIRDKSGVQPFKPGEYRGPFVEFPNTGISVLAQKSPKNINSAQKEKAKNIASNILGRLGSNNPIRPIADFFLDFLPVGESRVFADGDLEISGSVRSDKKIGSFRASSDGKLFSAGKFADAILGDNISGNEVKLLDVGAKDFVYEGAGINRTKSDYRYDPFGGGLTDYEGLVAFDLDKGRNILNFDVKHSFGGEIGLLARASGFPAAGALLRDLTLSVKEVPEPSTIWLFMGALLLLLLTKFLTIPQTHLAPICQNPLAMAVPNRSRTV